MVQFSVTPDYVSTAATQCDVTAGDVLAQLASLRTYVIQLVGQADVANGPADAYAWMGVTAGQFGIMMENVHQYSLALQDALRDIGTGLTFNNVQYVEVEATNLSGVTSVGNGAVPPARL